MKDCLEIDYRYFKVLDLIKDVSWLLTKRNLFKYCLVLFVEFL